MIEIVTNKAIYHVPMEFIEEHRYAFLVELHGRNEEEDFIDVDVRMIEI